MGPGRLLLFVCLVVMQGPVFKDNLLGSDRGLDLFEPLSAVLNSSKLSASRTVASWAESRYCIRHRSASLASRVHRFAISLTLLSSGASGIAPKTGSAASLHCFHARAVEVSKSHN